MGHVRYRRIQPVWTRNPCLEKCPSKAKCFANRELPYKLRLQSTKLQRRRFAFRRIATGAPEKKEEFLVSLRLRERFLQVAAGRNHDRGRRRNQDSLARRR